jgi:hypothetical protein
MARPQALPKDPERPQLKVTQFSGPGMVCGMGFAIALQADERLVRSDSMMDFVTYRLEGPGRAAVIYEGNAPQEADAVIATGRRFPSLVALHLDEGGYDASLARRILTKGKVPAACMAAQAE